MGQKTSYFVQLIKFSFLSFNYDMAGSPRAPKALIPRMFAFLPLTSACLLRSDFANEEIEKKEMDDDDHKLLRSEEFSGMDCYVVERIAKKQKDTNYSKRIVWVRKDTWLPMKIGILQQEGKAF